MASFDLPCFDEYWLMWNATDLSTVRGHLDAAVTDDFIFCDPLHWHVGRDALEANVRQLRADIAHAVFSLGSGVDHHHNRYRYDWLLTVDGEQVLQGFDVTTVADNGLIERIDGFFGPLPPRS